jgi:hypothetical protein
MVEDRNAARRTRRCGALVCATKGDRVGVPRRSGCRWKEEWSDFSRPVEIRVSQGMSDASAQALISHASVPRHG